MDLELSEVAVPQASRIQAYPAFDALEPLRDFLARTAWHFLHMPTVNIFVPLAPGIEPPTQVSIPEGFAPEVQQALDNFLHRVRFQTGQTADHAQHLLQRADVVLKWREKDPEANAQITAAKKTVFRVDAKEVRQEGSFYIQCAFDLFTRKEQLISDCQQKFQGLMRRLGKRDVSWVMATGPSVETYAEHDYRDATVIVCNSVVLNDALMQHCKPAILVFADPIFHFGVSQYAGKFREAVAQRLKTSDISVVVPFKYYPLLLSKFPEYASRIIGVPFSRLDSFNLDIAAEFQVKTTANILTLLLLPLATTFARTVHVIGCDGRPLDNNDYFWGHGQSVQINDKMANIRQVHPGFFAIDYNEYYFEHCHTLDRAIQQAEGKGKRFVHHGASHIPALRDRPAEDLDLSLAESAQRIAHRRQGETPLCVVLEPDGQGTSGHYVRWHRNLIEQLKLNFGRVQVLCNRRQDPKHYGCVAEPVFSSFTWGISRTDLAIRRDFSEHPGFTRFLEELIDGVRSSLGTDEKDVSLYVYYGSVQVLKAVQLARATLLKEGIRLKAFVCLFHESVLIEAGRTEPRFPPNAAEVLMEAAAQVDVFRLAAVTQRLADLVLSRFGVRLPAFPNPSPDRTDDASIAGLAQMDLVRPSQSPVAGGVVLLPANPREEKGSQIVSDLLEHFRTHGVPAGQLYMVRGAKFEDRPNIPGVQYIGDEVSDDIYWQNLRDSNIVIIPYQSPHFKYRTSGILVDALISAVPCIVMRDTWLADTVETAGAGLVVDYRSAQSLITAANVILAHHVSVRRRTVDGAKRYLLENSWARTAAFAVH